MKDEDLKELEATRNADEWNAICCRIKAENGGRYPGDWYDKVVLSGLAAAVAANW